MFLCDWLHIYLYSMDSKTSRVPGSWSSLLSADVTFEISGGVKSKSAKKGLELSCGLACTEKRHAQDVALPFEKM